VASGHVIESGKRLIEQGFGSLPFSLTVTTEGDVFGVKVDRVFPALGNIQRVGRGGRRDRQTVVVDVQVTVVGRRGVEDELHRSWPAPRRVADMATPLQKKKVRLGLGDMISRIANQATQAAQYPPTGTTTTSIPQTVNPYTANGATVNPYTPKQVGSTGKDANGDNYVAEGLLPPGLMPRMGPTDRAQPAYTPPTPAGRDANGDFYYPGDPGAGSGAQGPSGGPPAGTTTTGQTASGKGGKSPYASVADILAEPVPQSNDPKEWFQFNRDRMQKIGQFYGMTPDEIAAKEAEVQFQIVAAANQKDDQGNVVPSQLTNSQVSQIWQAAQEGIIAERDFNPDAATQQPTQQSATPMMVDTYGPDNPLSQYGVYTPEEIAGIQAAIGQYTQGAHDKFYQQTGYRAPDSTTEAYMKQAQAIPAIQALEGQAALARQVYQQQQQLQYYQIMSQMPQQDSSSGSMDGAQMQAMLQQLLGNGSGG